MFIDENFKKNCKNEKIYFYFYWKVRFRQLKAVKIFKKVLNKNLN